ncbi:MAG: 3-hydroxyacyl-CoA dehydrogenase, partial [Planctomycetes bacterium]|nr:3-hydroxyacyl-CoA dehydrogenase [Planctomycetota bacterium]
LNPALRGDCIIATNTSSLSITKIGETIGQPHRTVGMHFFNPAPIMKLVEVIQGAETDPAVVDRVAEIAVGWGKKVARAADVPGFIVNHVARPYYLEAFRILEDGYASPDVIDGAMKSLGGFRMGPLELTDFIGQDVNTATTRSVWEQLDRPALLTPSQLQETLVADGYLGRKTGRGVYDYGGDEPVVTLRVDHRSLEMTAELREAASGFVRKATNEAGDELEEYIFARILVALITQAKLANERGVAEKADIDTALKYGVNYPKGPFEWADQIGPERVNALKGALG